MKKSDIVVVNISIPNHVYVGCIGEMVYAKLHRKKIITIVGNTGNDKRFWTLYHSDIIVTTLNEALALL